MNHRMVLSATLLLALSAGAMATPQESVTFTNVNSFNTATGGSQAQAGVVLTNDFTGSYTTKKLRVSGSLSEVNTSTWASEARIYVIPPTGPAVTLQPFTTQSYTGTINVPAGYNLNIPSPFATTAGTWTFRFFESAQDAAFGSTDSRWDTITISLDDGVVDPPAFNYDFGSPTGPGPCNSATFDSTPVAIAANGVAWFKVVLPSIDRSLGQYLDLSSNGSVITGGTRSSDTVMALYTAAGVVVAQDDDEGIDSQSALSFGAQSPTRPNGNGVAHNGRDGATLAAGTYYIGVQEYMGSTTPFQAEFNRVAPSSGTAGTGTVLAHVTIGQFGSTVTGTPATFDNLGTLTADGNFNTQNFTVPALGVKWFKFNLATGIDSAARSYLDIDTEGTAGLAATSLALYDSTGALKVTDLTDGTDALSQISYGFAGSRPAAGNGLAYNGRDGATLAAGDYWLAVGTPAVGYSANWGVNTCDATTGAAQMRIRTGTIPPPAPPSVTYTFAPFSAPGTCQVTTVSSPGEALSAGAVVWYKVTLPAINRANGEYVDFTTNGSVIVDTAATAFPNDTVMGLYNVNGVVVDTDDDTGNGPQSALSFGATTPARPSGDTTLAGGDGATLAAGDYYVAVRHYFSGWGFGADFTPTGTSASVGTGTVLLNVTVGKNGGTATTVSGAPTATSIDPLVTDGSWQTSPPVPVSAPGVVWLSFTTSGIDRAARQFLDFDMEGSTVTNAALALYDSAGALKASDTADGSGTLPQLTYGFDLGRYGAGGGGLVYNGRDGATLAAGTYYIAVVVEPNDAAATFATNWSVTLPASCATPSGNAVFRYRTGVQGPFVTPTVDADLGTVTAGNSPQATASLTLPAGTLKWIHFKTVAPTDAATSFVDVHAYGSVISGALANDTEMAVYNSSGTVVAINDDFTETPTATLRESVLSWGATSTNRDYAPHPLGVKGQNGAVLPAGDYYVAIGAFNMDYFAEFFAVPLEPVDAGSVKITVITNTTSPACNPADVAGLGGNPGADGQNTVDDIVYYLQQFFASNVAVADIVGLGGPPNPADGQVTVDDLVYFLNRFFSPCNP